MNDTTSIWQSKKFIQGVLGLLVVSIIFVGIKAINEFKASSYVGRDVISQNVITVSGEGESFAKPDTATFSFTVEEKAAIVATAQKAADDKIKKALDFLKTGGVEEKDTKTISYQIYPEYSYGAQGPCTQLWGCPPLDDPKIVGYKVSQTIEVKIRDISKSGALLSGIGQVGVMNLSGLNFTVDNRDEIQAEARAEAIEKAEEKAEELADQLDVRLVRIVNFSESGSNPPIYFGKTDAAYGMGGGETVPSPVVVSPGETRAVSNVTITYEIR